MAAPSPAVPVARVAADHPTHRYPRGENDPAYRWAFTLWVVLFLGVICLGLVNYLMLYVKLRWLPNL